MRTPAPWRVQSSEWMPCKLVRIEGHDRDSPTTSSKGIHSMRESDTYQAILDEGREAELKGAILRNGAKRFGQPGEAITARLNAITEDVERLRRLLDRVYDGAATSWDDLLDTP